MISSHQLRVHSPTNKRGLATTRVEWSLLGRRLRLEMDCGNSSLDPAVGLIR